MSRVVAAYEHATVCLFDFLTKREHSKLLSAYRPELVLFFVRALLSQKTFSSFIQQESLDLVE